MSATDKPKKIFIDNWAFRVKYPSSNVNQSRVMLLLHGYQGNENAMWILTNPLPENFYLLAPRAPEKIGDDQYSWHAFTPQWPGIQTYRDLVDQLLERVDHWLTQEGINYSKLDVMGFSQGAVMAYALVLLYPERIGKVAALAGLIPQDWQTELDPGKLVGKAFFVAHGTQDDIIPIKKAHQATDWLKKNGAQVTFCEADIGHKLSANCFKGLGKFFS